MKTIFNNPEETNDPEKVNTAFNESMSEAKRFAEQNIGIVPRTSEIITAGSDVGDRLLVEANGTNKRIVLNIEGINYYVNLTAV